MKTVRTLVSTLCLVLTLSACADAAAPPDAASSAGGSAAAGDSTPVSAKEVCAYLEGQLPTLRGIGSETGAMANLTVNLYSWYEKQGAVPSGRQIDDQTGQECPTVRTELLDLAGMESFDRL